MLRGESEQHRGSKPLLEIDLGGQAHGTTRTNSSGLFSALILLPIHLRIVLKYMFP
jgi:hypothetical protein